MATKKAEIDLGFDGSEVAKVEEAPRPLAALDREPTVAMLLQAAIAAGTPVEALEKLVALHERVADRQAAREFAEAMSAFQSRCPAIPKSSRAKITTRAGVQYSYSYAELDQIAEVIRPLLQDLGLSFTWDSEVSDRTLSCTCTLRHVNGHCVTARFAAPIDTAAAMSETQKVAAALTYARRQSLVQVLGLTTTDVDDDAGSSESITENQAADLGALMREVGANEQRFLAYMGVEAVGSIRAADYARAVQALEAKRGKR